jgi:hypothetical protein
MELLGAGILTLSGHDKVRLQEKQTETSESSTGDGTVQVETNENVSVNQPSTGLKENAGIFGSDPAIRHGSDRGSLMELQVWI